MNTPPDQLGYLLTAYVEETLTDEGRQWVEAQLLQKPQLQDQLEAIRALRTALIGHLPSAPEELSSARRAQLQAYAASRPSRSRWLSRRRLAAVAARMMAVIGVYYLSPVFNRSRDGSGGDLGQAPVFQSFAENDGRGAGRAALNDRKLVAEVDYDQEQGGADRPREEAESPTESSEVMTRPATVNKKQPVYSGYGANGTSSAGVLPPDATAPAAPAPPSVALAINEINEDVPSDQFAGKRAADQEVTQNILLLQTPDAAPVPGAKAVKTAQEPLTADDNGFDQESRPVTPEPIAKVEHDMEMVADSATGASALVASPWHLEPTAPRQRDLDKDVGRDQPTTPGASALQMWGMSSAGLSGARRLIAPAPQGGISDRDLLQQFQSTGPAASDGEAAQRLACLPPGAPLQVNDQSYGQALLAAARRNGLQLRFEDGGCRLHAQAVPLDPTALYGWDATLFARTFETSPMQEVARSPRLTFALDSDTSSFAMARSRLEHDQLPDPRSIQPEQFINAMPLDYPPATGAATFTLYAEAGPSPFAVGALAPRTALLALGVVTRAPAPDERRPLDLVVAVDCSGSMARPGSLDRIQLALHEMAAQLRADDQLTIVRFSDQAAVALPATAGNQVARIDAAISGLRCGGSTNGAEGLMLAYQLAAEHLQGGSEHRVLFATDGATLQGPAATRVWERLAGYQADGIALMVVGCGGDDRQQRALQDLADHAHGQHVYLASDDQARELARGPLLPGHLQILARDAKVQVTWNPQRVAYARLIGYEQRRLQDADFRRNDVAAGELAHEVQVTALFEIVLTEGSTGPLGAAAVRCFDTRWQAVREQAFPLPGSLLAPLDSPRLELCACAAQLAELLQHGWWSNVRCASWPTLVSHLETLPTNDTVRAMLEMSQTACSLETGR